MFSRMGKWPQRRWEANPLPEAPWSPEPGPGTDGPRCTYQPGSRPLSPSPLCVKTESLSGHRAPSALACPQALRCDRWPGPPRPRTQAACFFRGCLKLRLNSPFLSFSCLQCRWALCVNLGKTRFRRVREG